MKRLLFFVSLLTLGIFPSYSQHPMLDWVHTFKNPNYSIGYDLATDGDNNLYAIIGFAGATDFDPGVSMLDLGPKGLAILKFDASGNLIWGKSLTGGFGASALAIDQNNNVFVTGSMYDGTVDFDPGAGEFNLTNPSLFEQVSFVLKLDEAGDFGWAKLLSASKSVIGKAIEIDILGNVCTAGYFLSSTDFDPGPDEFILENLNETSHAYFLKLDNDGDFIWAKSIQGSGNNFPRGLASDGLGNIYSTGYFNGSSDFNPGAGTAYLSASSVYFDLFVLKLDSLGDYIWAKKAGGAQGAQGSRLRMDMDGNLILTGIYVGTANMGYGTTGQTFTSAGEGDLFTSKLTSAGTLIWNSTITSSGTSSAFGSNLTTDGAGNVYVAGYFLGTVDADPGGGTLNLTSVTEADVLIQKLDASGNLLWALSFGSEAYDNIRSITVDGYGAITSIGEYGGIADFDPSSGVYADTSGSNLAIGNVNCFIHRLKPFGLSVEEVTEPSTLLYPNPTKSSLVITLDENIGDEVTLRVFDNNGHQMMDRYEYQFAGSSTFDVSHLRAGTYFVQLQSNGKQWVKRFVKL
jgi:hypothetical protein